MNEPTDALLSTGDLATRLGVSQSAVKLWEREGVIPRGIVVEGSGRKVWRLVDLPAIRKGLEERRARRERSPLDAA
jgi:DNA-binding transcriptional MerR regulator